MTEIEARLARLIEHWGNSNVGEAFQECADAIADLRTDLKISHQETNEARRSLDKLLDDRRKQFHELDEMRIELADLRRQLDEARETAHYANGVADLAMKHRDIAEAEVERLRKRAEGEPKEGR